MKAGYKRPLSSRRKVIKLLYLVLKKENQFFPVSKMLYILIKVQEILDPCHMQGPNGQPSLAHSWLLKKQLAHRGHQEDAPGSPSPSEFLSTF